jgi:hypothetical protein
MQIDPDCHLFEEDMQQEILDLLSTNTIEIAKCPSIPSDNKPLQAIWSFCHKQAPNWSILKHKARLCPHGGLQLEGINFWETYALGISWRPTRLVLILSLLSGLKSHQVDYVLAYTQAPLDCELFRNIPPGFVVDCNTLCFTTEHMATAKNASKKINKNIYGLHQAGNNWSTALHGSLLALGISQSKVDPCLFICHNCIIVMLMVVFFWPKLMKSWIQSLLLMSQLQPKLSR